VGAQEVFFLMYRRRLRQLLYEAGVPSNPAVTDEWILDRVTELVKQKVPTQKVKS